MDKRLETQNINASYCDTRLEKQLEFLREIDKVKQIFRQTLLMDSSRTENDAEHSWHMAIGALLFLEYMDEEVKDIARMLSMILLHDVIEIYAGDTYAYDEVLAESQEIREREAADKVFGLLPIDQGSWFRELWDEFEAFETPEAKGARVADGFMPVYHNYITKGAKWQEHKVTSQQVRKRILRIKKGSLKLYEQATKWVDESVQKGYLAK